MLMCDTINDLVRRFLSTIESGDEHATHRFLVGNPSLLLCLMGNWRRRILHLFSQYRLGDQLVPDLVLVGDPSTPNSVRPCVVLVELESPQGSLFTKSGDPTAALTHAMRQVRDWRIWIKRNRDYFDRRLCDRIIGRLQSQIAADDEHAQHWLRRYQERLYRHGVNESFSVILGRRQNLSDHQAHILEEMIQEHQVSVFTYDALADFAIEAPRGVPESGGQA